MFDYSERETIQIETDMNKRVSNAIKKMERAKLKVKRIQTPMFIIPER